jgi:hypothetical protein
MDINQIIDTINKSSDKRKREWHDKTIMLFRQFESALFLSEPYRLVLDSNIIMRFEEVDTVDNDTSLLAILTFFSFFNSQCNFRASILIRPAVYYELIRRRQLVDELDYWQQCKKIKNLIKDSTGTDALFEDLSSFKTAQYWISKIQEDEIKIKQEMKSILSKDWDFDFIRTEIGFDSFVRNDGNLLAIPTSVARQSVILADLQFFDTQITKLCLADHILEKLVTNPNNNQDIIAKYYNQENHLLHRIIKLRSNGELEGLADLDFLSTCNVNRQFQIQANHNYKPSSIPMTIDSRLNEGLKAFSKGVVINTVLIAGESAEIMMMKFEQSLEQQKRIEQSRQLFNEFDRLAQDFWEGLYKKITFAL